MDDTGSADNEMSSCGPRADELVVHVLQWKQGVDVPPFVALKFD